MLTGSHVLLRAWRDEDIAFFHVLRNDFETQLTLLAEPRPQTLEQVRTWLDVRTRDRDQVFFVIAARESNEPVGFVELRSVQPIHGWGQLGICLAPAVRGQSWGPEALTLLEQFARDVLGLRKIVLHVLASHSPAVRLYEGSGYRRVGVHEAHFCHGRHYHDVAVMEKGLAEHPPAVTPWIQ